MPGYCLQMLLGAGLVIGAALVLFAMPISLRYNAWTTKVRERRNRAPSTEMRAKNTRIFAWIVRILGLVLLLLGGLVYLGTRP
jgi:hypothetical protein